MKFYRLTSLLVSSILISACTASAAPTATLPPPPVPPTAPLPTATAVPPAATPVPTPLPYTTPQWAREAVIYQIFVRSFYDSNGDGIGDLRGITQKLDYIKSLGATALWLTPIFASPSYHGYDTTDYYTINPDFGTKEDLIELVNAVHSRGMRIILDYVASHTSNAHPFFKDAYANPNSKYSGWYIWKDKRNLNYESFFGVKTLPTINHGSEQANAYFVDVAEYWIDLDGDGDYTDGIDGWRCDYAPGSPHKFWKQLRAALKPLNPDVLLLGEVWVDKPASQAPYFTDEFDALFDFPIYIQLQGKPEFSGDGILNGQSFISILTDKIEEQKSKFPPEAIPVRFAGNHDTDRIATEVGGDPARQRLAAFTIAMLDGAPMLYYGEEIGMAGSKGGGPIYDEYRREPMDWYAKGTGPGLAAWFKEVKYSQPNDGVSVEEQEADPDSLLNYYRRLYAVRHANPALASGAYVLIPIKNGSGVWAYWRYSEAQIVAVLINFGEAETTVGLDLSSAPRSLGTAPKDLLTGEAVTVNPAAVKLAPAQGAVWDWTP
jgi:glycosidase